MPEQRLSVRVPLSGAPESLAGRSFQADLAQTTPYIFIVGVSRSGTTLMRKILNASDSIAIAMENHFLGHLIPSEGARHKFRKFGDLSEDRNVQRLVDYIYSDEFLNSSRYRNASSLWRWLVRRVEKQEFLRRILESDRSERGLFTVMMQAFAEHEGKPIMGEKTPAHIRYVPTIFQWFPQGRVIHMLRDPRGVFVSELRRRRKQPASVPYRLLKRLGLLKPFILLQVTLVWYESIYRYLKHSRRYPDNYYLLKFEDLVSSPEYHIREVCHFLGVEFQEKMLQQVVVSKGFQAGQAGFDRQAADRWKAHIEPWIDWWFRLWFGRHLRRLGYTA